MAVRTNWPLITGEQGVRHVVNLFSNPQIQALPAAVSIWAHQEVLADEAGNRKLVIRGRTFDETDRQMSTLPFRIGSRHRIHRIGRFSPTVPRRLRRKGLKSQFPQWRETLFTRCLFVRPSERRRARFLSVPAGGGLRLGDGRPPRIERGNTS